MNEDEVDETIAYLYEVGALSISGMDGEDFTYNVNPEIMKIVCPAFYEAFMAGIDETLIELIDQDLVKVEYDEDLKPWFSVTDKGQAVAEDIILFQFPDEV
jgi:hypothetical protein